MTTEQLDEEFHEAFRKATWILLGVAFVCCIVGMYIVHFRTPYAEKSKLFPLCHGSPKTGQ